MVEGRSVRLFMVDGSSSGLLTAEIVNWTGHVLHAPRSRLADVLGRPEAAKTGIYFLFGDIMEAGAKRPVYIGESDNVGKRLRQHERDETKEFFERFCIVTSKDANLTKAHARYLESRLSEVAKMSGRAVVLNGNEPAAGSLPESDVADMEFFLRQVQIILPVLGYDVLKPPLRDSNDSLVRSLNSVSDSWGEKFPLRLTLKQNREGLSAIALEMDGEFLVLKGSHARKSPANANTGYPDLRDTLISDGRLAESIDKSVMEFTEDVAFSSPSAASGVIFGRADNGRTSWLIDGTTKTLKDYQSQLTEAAE